MPLVKKGFSLGTWSATSPCAAVGYLAGYLSDIEGWDHIMAAALRLQQTFGSWQDLQSDFLMGREYWSLQETQLTGARFREIYERFLQDPASPGMRILEDWT